jgi:hypothetical protein
MLTKALGGLLRGRAGKGIVTSKVRLQKVKIAGAEDRGQKTEGRRING